MYGDPELLPIAEDAPLAPVSPYGRHRVESEQLAAESGVPLAIARVFSAYGEGLRRQVLWDVARRALAGGPVELSGTGEETRDFVHARDVAAAVSAIAQRSAFQGEIVNVATGAETTIADLARLTRTSSAAREVRFTGVGRPGDPARWRADIGRLRSLGFEPSVAIEDGAPAYARWVRGRPREGRARPQGRGLAGRPLLPPQPRPRGRGAPHPASGPSWSGSRPATRRRSSRGC